jgi:hypothetical protein
MTPELEDAFERARKEAVMASDSIEGAFLRGADDINHAFTDAFERAFETGKLSFTDLMDDLKSIIGRTVFQAFIQPAVSNAITPLSSQSISQVQPVEC